MDKGVSRLEEWCEKSNLYENQDLFNRQVHELEDVKGTDGFSLRMSSVKMIILDVIS